MDDLGKYNEINTKDDIITALINVRSRNSNFELLEAFLMTLANSPSILVCSETWKTGCEEMFHIQGYKMYYNQSQVIAVDGIVIYIR